MSEFEGKFYVYFNEDDHWFKVMDSKNDIEFRVYGVPDILPAGGFYQIFDNFEDADKHRNTLNKILQAVGRDEFMLVLRNGE